MTKKVTHMERQGLIHKMAVCEGYKPLWICIPKTVRSWSKVDCKNCLNKKSKK